MTVQVADGRWPGEIGSGVLMSDEAFDFVEPFIAAACADWTSEHRYGNFELSLPDRKRLVTKLLLAADSHSQSKLLADLARWLEPRSADNRPVSILGY